MTTSMATPLTLSDPGKVRTISARWVITAELVLLTATRLGGRSGSPVDMPVLRDALTGSPLLTGSTLAGAVRAYLTDRLAGYGRDEPKQVATLFGGSRGVDEGTQSPLVVFDSIGSLNGAPVEIRDGVKIDGVHGTAADNKKFDGEVLPAGTTFPVRFELVIADTKSEIELIGLLAHALAGLSDGEVALGARRSRGMGRLESRCWKAKRFDLSSASGWLEWLMSDAKQPLASIEQTHDSACASLAGIGAVATPLNDVRERVRIEATLAFTGGLLVRSPGRTADAPDVIHLKSANQSVLPGTSLAGALRNRAYRIARVVHVDENIARQRVEDLFGPELQGNNDSNFQPQASRLRVSENVVRGGLRQRPTRIRIDRFTQGVFESALFDEEPDYGGNVLVTLELRNPTHADIGFLLLLTKDLMTGDVAVGGTASVGRGTARGAAQLQCLGGPHNGRRITLNPNQPLPPDDMSFVDDAIEAFHSPPAAGGTQNSSVRSIHDERSSR